MDERTIDPPKETEHLFIQVEGDISILWVKGGTPVHNLATRIRALMDEGRRVATRGMGAGPTNQAAKAWAIVRQQYVSEGSELLVKPSFVTVNWHGDPSSALVLEGVVSHT
jgi:stage V sporulation protein SpoVS